MQFQGNPLVNEGMTPEAAQAAQAAMRLTRALHEERFAARTAAPGPWADLDDAGRAGTRVSSDYAHKVR